jgi:hypothetical protein
LAEVAGLAADADGLAGMSAAGVGTGDWFVASLCAAAAMLSLTFALATMPATSSIAQAPNTRASRERSFMRTE